MKEREKPLSYSEKTRAKLALRKYLGLAWQEVLPEKLQIKDPFGWLPLPEKAK